MKAKGSGISDLKEQVQTSENSKREKYQSCSYSARSEVATLDPEIPTNQETTPVGKVIT